MGFLEDEAKKYKLRCRICGMYQSSGNVSITIY